MRSYCSAIKFLAGLVVLFACSIGGTAELNYRLIITYGGDHCCGTSGKDIDRIGKVISKHQKISSKTFSSKRVPWGKEGEYTLCYQLSELSEQAQNQLLKELVAAANVSSKVKIQENSLCKGGWS